MVAYDAVVLAGGRGARLGGVDKAALEVGGRTLLSRALAATGGAARTIVVGPSRPLPPGVLTVIEHPPGGGPAAALAAGLVAVEAEVVVALACDLPHLTGDRVARLVRTLSARAAADGVAYTDEEGRRQPLAAAYRAAVLRSAYHRLGEPHGASLHRLTRLLTVIELADDPETAMDCDTWADVARARDLVEER